MNRVARGWLGMSVAWAIAGCAPAAGDRAGANGAADGGNAAAEQDAGPPPEPVEERLARMLEGRFSSRQQAIANPSYFDVRIATCRVDRPDLGPRVLYIEQARADTLSQPYRQRLYVVEADPAGGADSALSRVFELRNPGAAIGTCDLEAPRDLAGTVEEKDGCAVQLAWQGDRFEGGTVGTGCGSTLNGATYATSTVTVLDNQLQTWDRGFDARDQQVWGAVAGPYLFDRLVEP